MALKEKSNIKDEYKWKLEDIFSTNEDWEETYFATEELLPTISNFQDKLSDDFELAECLKLSTKISQSITRLYQFARMHRDEDTRSDFYQSMADKAEMLSVKYSTLASFITPELSVFDKSKLEALAKSKKFLDYSVYFEEIIRDKSIILSKKEEKLLREMGIFCNTNEEVFGMFDNADIKFVDVENEKGELIEMSHGIYSTLLQSPSQDVRKRAFESMFSAFESHKNMLATNYAGNVKKDWFFAKIRGFSSSLDYSMYTENVPSTCYKKLLLAVSEGTKPLHRYVALRKRILGGGKLNMYDLYVPMVKKAGLELDYDKAVSEVKESLKVMGAEYSAILDEAFSNRWIDVYETKGKRSGAYAWGCYGVHPFVLLNYQKTTHDVFTITHEIGHALHSYYSNKSQSVQKAGYEIFVAEIASTVNEVLLLKHLMKNAEGDFKKYLASYYLDMFRTTLFRQTMFAEFEQKAHEMVEQNQPLTAKSLSDCYYELNKKYYGSAVEHNDLIRFEWARIPHFYSAFYVYKYATGLTSAVTIADNILKYGESYFEKYKKFLSAGGSLPPLEILKFCDVDLESEEPYKRAMKEFSDTLDILEKEF